MAIPKIIHYCWLSDDPFPPKIQRCIDSWKKYLPDYELRLWNFERFNKDDSDWVREAFDAKKYAFAADFLRFYAVYNYGGIYLDCDVEVVRSFDPLLNSPYFIGFENVVALQVEPACFGAVQGTQWVGDCLEYYSGKKFVKTDGSFDMTILPVVMRDSVFHGKYELAKVNSPDEISSSSSRLYVLNREFTYSYELVGKPQKETYAIHHYDGGWMPKKTRLVNRFFAVLAKVLYQLLGAKRFHDLKGRFWK